MVSGPKAYEEEKWKEIQIGNCIFEVVTYTKRCMVITIDPETAKVDKNNQPLRELSTYKNNNDGVNFGVYLVPLTSATIHHRDTIIINP